MQFLSFESGTSNKRWCNNARVSFRFSPDIASKRGLTTAEMTAVEAIHRAVEFNPHVPKVSSFLNVLTRILCVKSFNSIVRLVA